MRRDWLFEISESPLRGYWKQFSYLVSVSIVRITCGSRGQSTPG